MKNALAKYFLGFFGAIGALLAGLAGYQQVCLRMARKKKDETHVMETYHAKEGEIAYRSVGHGKPLVLVHSMMLGASGREWDAVIDALAEDYHVYVPDLPGFGNSFCPEKPWTAYQYANLLHAFIEDVIGHPGTKYTFNKPVTRSFIRCGRVWGNKAVSQMESAKGAFAYLRKTVRFQGLPMERISLFF